MAAAAVVALAAAVVAAAPLSLSSSPPHAATATSASPTTAPTTARRRRPFPIIPIDMIGFLHAGHDFRNVGRVPNSLQAAADKLAASAEQFGNPATRRGGRQKREVMSAGE